MPLNDVSRETDAALKKYLGLLEKWQAKINLVSPQTMPDAWERHFIDSMQISDFIPQNVKIIFDFGSGAGFPGLVLAMMSPDKHFHMVESDQKKCSIMRTVSRETGLNNVTCHYCRFVDVQRETTPDLIMARALASLDKLLDYSKDWIDLNSDLQFIFPKGERHAEEVAEAQKKWVFEALEKQSKTSENASILLLSGVRAV
jgi:16S rRNA (guanine527-N7)-methyltransferase